MKKFFILLVVIFLVSSFVAIAEEGDSDIDFASMSVEELFQVIEDANNELALRGEYTILLEGTYLVGTDIPSGKYVISEHHTKEKEDADWRLRLEDLDGEYIDSYKIVFASSKIVDVPKDSILKVYCGLGDPTGTFLTISKFESIIIK